MRAALGRVKAKVLMQVSLTDAPFPGYLSRELYAGLRDATWVEIPTIGVPGRAALRRMIRPATWRKRRCAVRNPEPQSRDCGKHPGSCHHLR